jgi:hypothetical protein
MDHATKGARRARSSTDKPSVDRDPRWAKCLDETPDILADIARFVQEARLRILDSPPLSPTKADKSDSHE